MYIAFSKSNIAFSKSICKISIYEKFPFKSIVGNNIGHPTLGTPHQAQNIGHPRRTIIICDVTLSLIQLCI